MDDQSSAVISHHHQSRPLSDVINLPSLSSKQNEEAAIRNGATTWRDRRIPDSTQEDVDASETGRKHRHTEEDSNLVDDKIRQRNQFPDCMDRLPIAAKPNSRRPATLQSPPRNPRTRITRTTPATWSTRSAADICSNKSAGPRRMPPSRLRTDIPSPSRFLYSKAIT